MPNEKLIFLSFPVFKTIFAASNQAQQKSNSRTANSQFKEKATIMYNAPQFFLRAPLHNLASH